MKCLKRNIWVFAIVVVIIMLVTIACKNRNMQKETDINTQHFNTEDFGKDTVSFRNGYVTPAFYPDAKVHPRVMMHASEVETIASNIRKEDNSGAYADYIELSNRDISGKFNSIGGDNVSLITLATIEAQAFRYAMTKDSVFGYKAINAIKNAILTADASDTMDPYRSYGVVMYVAACVYDWCYDLLTDTDKTQIINGVVNKIGSYMEVGAPPSKEGAIAHHTVECQILRSWLAFAIAVYDEKPEIYDYVMGRLLEEIVPAQNFMMSSGRHWEGSYYGPFRTVNLMDAQLLVSAMTEHDIELFDGEVLHKVCSSFIDYTLPGISNSTTKIHVFEIGDRAASSFGDYYAMAFLSGNYFRDSALKMFATMRYHSNNKPSSGIDSNYISTVRYLIVNEPDLDAESYWEGRSLVNVTAYPSSSIFARSSWQEDDAVAIYMNMQEYFSSSHSHMDCGSFQIYYKGMLASDSGYYDAYGSKHHNAYSIQTISANSLLVYNGDLADSLGGEIGYYSGGQTLVDESRRRCARTLTEALSSSSMNQATVFGKMYSAFEKEYQYSYLAGDMTKAYDTQTVDEVTRHMLSVMTDEADYPMVFVTFDRIAAKRASYKKTYLLHSKEVPEVTSDGKVIIKAQAGSGGKLIVQSLITDVNHKVYGGNGEEYTINGTAFIPTNYDALNQDYRIELSPEKEALTDHLLTVMYVTDATNNTAPINATEIHTDDFVGASIFNRVMLFAKHENDFSSATTFVTSGEGNMDYYVSGVSAGQWEVSVNGAVVETVTVEDGSGILTFTASAGTISLDKK